MDQTLTIAVPGAGAVTAILTTPEPAAANVLFVYAPGAGSNLQDPFGVFAGRELAKQGVASLRFQFPYQEAKRRGPDRPPLLEATWRAVIEATRSPGARPVIGGRSMGGRIASQVVAQGEPVAALALFAYPLHPPGRPDQARDAHLSAITVPTLFCSGTRDAFATPEELRAAASKIPRSTVHLIDGADHGFNVLKASGRTRPHVWSEAVAALVGWLEALTR